MSKKNHITLDKMGEARIEISNLVLQEEKFAYSQILSIRFGIRNSLLSEEFMVDKYIKANPNCSLEKTTGLIKDRVLEAFFDVQLKYAFPFLNDEDQKKLEYLLYSDEENRKFGAMSMLRIPYELRSYFIPNAKAVGAMFNKLRNEVFQQEPNTLFEIHTEESVMPDEETIPKKRDITESVIKYTDEVNMFYNIADILQSAGISLEELLEKKCDILSFFEVTARLNS